MLHGYAHLQILSKSFAKQLEGEIVKSLRNIEEISLEEI
jgi:hypothetical protein